MDRSVFIAYRRRRHVAKAEVRIDSFANYSLVHNSTRKHLKLSEMTVMAQFGIFGGDNRVNCLYSVWF